MDRGVAEYVEVIGVLACRIMRVLWSKHHHGTLPTRNEPSMDGTVKACGRHSNQEAAGDS